MTDENGNLSIDFLAGFTIFMVAFIWVVTMIPGLMIGLQSYTIDYDAVAYRTGVILLEDPGWPVSPPWESYTDMQKSNVTRFGLALSKDTPNILSQDKVNRFFCETAFIFPDDYHTRAIFGDYPYGFNISLIDLGGGQNRSRGDALPDIHGTIRRLVKIKGTSNATIGNAKYTGAFNKSYISKDNATIHVFSILIDNPKLLSDVTDPVYQIDPSREQITIDITDLRSTITEFPPTITRNTSQITLKDIKIYKRDGNSFSNIPLSTSEYPYVDGSSTRIPVMQYNVSDNVTLKFSPRFFDLMKAQSSQIYIALGFEVAPASTFLNNTQALPDFNNLDGTLTFINNTNTTPFNYNYDPINVTQPRLRDAVVEVAVWSGSATGPTGGGGLPVPNGSFIIQVIPYPNGTIFPGSVSVNNGANKTFTITPNTGYHITDVFVDTVSQGAISTYTFINVVQDHKISASAAINQYTITPSVIGGNGTISPATVQTVNYGATPTFTITPINAFYHIADVSVNGISVGTVTSYTFPAVMTNYTINASFALGPAPAFTNITPNSGTIAGGTPVTIVGTNFASGGSFGVTIGGAAATSVVLVDSSHITAFTPAGTAGARDVVITNNDGQIATGVGQYTYVIPITTIGAITGTPQVGSVLTAGALTPAGATATYQWQSSAALGGPYSNIAGATSTTYTTIAGDVGRYIRVTATGTGSYTGTVTSAAVGPVTTPLTGIGVITGSLQGGSVLTAGALTPAGATATYQWQSSAALGGPYSNIAGATSTTYTTIAGDVGRYIKVVATGTGAYTGTVTSTAAGPVTAIPLTAIGAITGSLPRGSVLTAGALTPAGATATYQWQSSAALGGPYSNIAGATSPTYTTVIGDVGRYIRVRATGTGSYTGTVTSAARGPVT